MNSIYLLLCGIVLFTVAYISYGAYLSRKLGIDRNRKTPAHTMRDNIDYVPAKAPVLLGHHFASIAGAGPILGPIIASAFGWLPVYLWIVLGGIFLGAVHDFTALVASVRHQSRSIGQVIEEYLGYKGKMLFLIFAFSAMILVIAVFSKIVATTFVALPAVATASVLFIIVAILFGLAINRQNMRLVPATGAGIILMILCIYIGGLLPLSFDYLFVKPDTAAAVNELTLTGELAGHNPVIVRKVLTDKGMTDMAADVHQAGVKAERIWIAVLLIYIMVASVVPVWLLLQPRDYLNSFLLYAVLVAGVVGALFAHPPMNLPAFTSFKTELGYLFPVLFVTVACGAISGAHALIASGTTSKQLDKETDAKFIGMGGMLIESTLAILALIVAGGIAHSRFQALSKGGDFISIFSEGFGWVVAKIPLINMQQRVGMTFAGLAISAFTLTTLDTCTRIGRYAFQELFTKKNVDKQPLLARNRYLATLITILLGSTFIFTGSSTALWPVFGSANQLLAALSLLAVSVWLSHRKQKAWFVLVPMILMYIVTLAALLTLIYQNSLKQNYTLTCAGGFLLIVALLLAWQAFQVMWKSRIKQL